MGIVLVCIAEDAPHLKIGKMSHHSSPVFSGKGQGTPRTDFNRNIVRHCFFWTMLYFRRILERAKQSAQHLSACLAGQWISSCLKVPASALAQKYTIVTNGSPGFSHGKHTGRNAIPWDSQLLQRARWRPWEAFNSREHPYPVTPDFDTTISAGGEKGAGEENV